MIKKIIALIIKLSIFLLLLGFAIKNAEFVTIKYYLGYAIDVPLILVILVVFIFGMLFGMLTNLDFVLKKRKAFKTELAQVEKAQHTQPLDPNLSSTN